MMHVITGGSGSGKSAYAEMWLTGKPEKREVFADIADRPENVIVCRKTESILQEKNEVCPYLYIATMRPFGAETQKKIERHRRMRAGKGFQTLECYGDLRTFDNFIQNWKRDADVADTAMVGNNALNKSFFDINKAGKSEKIQKRDKTRGIPLECVSNLLADVLYREDGSLAEDEVVMETIVEGIRYLNTQTERLAIVTNEVHSDLQDYSEETRKYIELLGRINQELGKMADQVTEVVYGIPVKIK